MKTLRYTMFALALVLSAGSACSTTITAPDCEDPATCEPPPPYQPGGNNYQPGGNNYQPGGNN